MRITLPLVAPGLVATGIFAFIQAWNEFIFALVIMNKPENQTLPGLAAGVQRGRPRHRLGRGDGRLDADGDPGDRVLPDRPAAGGHGAHGRCREGMSLESLALRVLLPSFRGPDLPPDWARLLDEGLGGVCLFGSNLTGRPGDARALADAVRRARADALVAVDEEGGDVTRLHARTGSPVLGAAQLGAIDDLGLTTARGARSVLTWRRPGSTSTWGPVADVNSNPDNPVIGTRSFGSEPDLV